ncbi:DUF4007 family protein [Acinetobacter pragensis]|uniref:DUF4007 domain-containing protein n=1 Tax=Acinetobacter pragensis TaxID=1806892 RepID=A0A151Y0B7_9GAMM|nr:DUF4007 family protein [Acinetobacter pragensis]KYQ71480.1 hypothetical protein AZH43_14110 [Acinetobacter pragensis]
MIQLPSDIKLIFSGHETFALRQLWLKKAYTQVQKYQDSSELVCPKSVFSSNDAVERFGVGKNMVASIKHWGLATDVIRESEKSNGFRLGEIGNFLFDETSGVDPFLEHEASYWLIHWYLAGKSLRSTSWYVLFNCLNSNSFNQDDVVSLINDLVSETENIRSKKTLENDVDTCLKSYVSDNDTEDGIESLLSKLGLIKKISKNLYQFNYSYHESLSDFLFCYAILDFWESLEERHGTSQSTLSFKNITYDYGSPGRVFKLTEYSINERLSHIEDISNGYLGWTDSSGLKQITKLKNETVGEMKKTLLRLAYVS